MNTRINELAVQSNLVNYIDWEKSDYKIDNALTSFSQLIASECLTILASISIENSNKSAFENAIAVEQEVKKRFGIR